MKKRVQKKEEWEKNVEGAGTEERGGKKDEEGNKSFDRDKEISNQY